MERSETRVEKAEVARRMAAFDDACFAHGLASTHQRRVIYEALAGTTSHPSAEELFAFVRRQLPSISLATVYKNLATFRDAGLVHAVPAGENRVRFDANLARHHHLFCRVCERMQDVTAAPLDRVKLPTEKASGFFVETHEVLFRGVCARCQAKVAK